MTTTSAFSVSALAGGTSALEALLVFVVHDTNPHAATNKVRGYTQAQHWFQDLTTLA